MNMQHAGGDGAKFTHSAKSTFLMSKAYTYVSISASADLDMFFMDFDIFADQVAPEPTGEGAASFVESSGTKISYKGLLGY